MTEIPKQYFEYLHVHDWISKIVSRMYRDMWRPDYIVGLSRGGLVPAVILSHYIKVPMHSLKVSLRDGDNDNETNCWMAEDAFGYVPYDGVPPRPNNVPYSDSTKRKNILIVDDINDTGATLDWIIDDWQSSCLPNDPSWTDIWGNNVRFAVLVDNLSSNFSRKVNYTVKEINKAEKDVWIVFPWER